MLDNPNNVQAPPPGYPYQSPQPSPEQQYYAQRQSFARGILWQIVVTSLLVIVAFASGWFGNAFVNRGNYVSPNSDEHLILQAWDAVSNNFVDTNKINSKKMAYAAIDAMVNSLGDTGHSRFQTKAEFDEEQNQLNNASTVGIGVYLSGGGKDPLRIDAIIPDSPAAKSGKLKPGDFITAVDGKDISGMTIAQVRPLITGKAGTSVTLTIKRSSTKLPTVFDVTLVRASFTAPIVVSYTVPELNIAVIQITQFASGADKELKQAIKDAKAKNVQGIVLDLRDNPGGYLNEAISVASEFIPAGPNKNVLIVRTRADRQPQAVETGGLATTMPLAILVNGNTASAAEIVTGAIKVNRPDVHVIGEKTFGTGTVLQPFTLADGSVILIGTAEFLLPDGSSIYNKGIQPDQPLTLPKNVVPVSPLVAQELGYSLKQVEQSGDTQLIKALEDISGQNLQQPAA
ncbi:MAG TPA: S41 family peptidase [Ktedonobacterales bacterium]|nr:S41 family peptidase [Ktedonobacterales bacterium]